MIARNHEAVWTENYNGNIYHQQGHHGLDSLSTFSYTYDVNCNAIAKPKGKALAIST
ncbi:hypothetical protein [Sphingobacterium cellulitidis]|uniref:hypothetical protein n=1 Tax=Sphingobacterium cellulitidis TaxID=1768011 RepID=UPI0015FA12D4|nr:hypothetical protein [Sphingobacterium soli]MBA8986136.1 hypothetical protein [Sphingobacterium soli]